MTTISSFMADDHQRCDRLFAEAEEQVANGQWEAAASSFDEMHKAIEHHFSMEEEVLFPTFEEVTGSSMGPTQIMRHEHEQMRQLFTQMAKAVENRQTDDYLGASETLLVLMQQHNAKEEQILYPMTDAQLADQSDVVLKKMQSL
jgi:hemerythrin-like domain-containing protein